MEDLSLCNAEAFDLKLDTVGESKRAEHREAMAAEAIAQEERTMSQRGGERTQRSDDETTDLLEEDIE